MDVQEDRDRFVRDGEDGDGACRGREIEIDDDVLHAFDHVELVQRLHSGSRPVLEDQRTCGDTGTYSFSHFVVHASCCMAGSKCEWSLDSSGRPRL